MKRKPIKLKNQIKNMTIEEVYKQFEKFIYKVCQTWRRKYEIDDLVQVAFLGLNKAYENYDIEKNVLFLTYASMLINNELRLYHRKNKKHENNISMSTTFQLKDNNLELEDTLQDDINYEDVAITNIEYGRLKLAMKKLTQNEQRIIEALHFQYRSQKEIANELNLTQPYVSRVYRKVLQKLKIIMEGENMPQPKITRNQLIEEVKVLGTTKEATIKIGEKYGLSPSTIRTYFDSMNVREYGKRSNLNRPKDNKNTVIEQNLLIPIYKGPIGEYEILDEKINIKSKDSSITIMKDDILALISELQELSKILG
ncbi:sigma-70 family RNA polymerase sigma factor [Clostridium sp. MB40-C1]|uniref:sigma-70 family RNA polymerase sigma factor n=1 Tax=Clostridium sp. MB40-C1 TaxID=3070996 RepID=UPI0027E1ACA7|nr:sigma-70 family RNA polymerase sigma factor [Clostridium sp. MB40-C1]WMJ79561.1 sigma-70 family RNA polymerase sigma factor [Clostridium sp. MB40-C1]